MSFTTWRNTIRSKKLHKILRKQDIRSLARFLSRQPSPSVLRAPDSQGRSPVLFTVICRNAEMAKLLIEAGADVDSCSRLGEAPIYEALKVCTILALLIKADAKLDVVDAQKQTPLHIAVIQNKFEAVKMLIEASCCVDTYDQNNCTPLHLAASSNRSQIARLLLDAGAKVDTQDNDGLTPLHIALENGYLELARALLEAGADVTLQDRKGKASIHHVLSKIRDEAGYEKIREILTLLMDAGAVVDPCTVPIRHSIPHDMARLIVPEDTHFWLAANNDAPMLAAELAGGLAPSIEYENGMTLLHWACAGDAPECVQLLLDAGAHGKGCWNKLVLFAMHKSSDCLDRLLSVGVAFDRYDCIEHPINYALAINSAECVSSIMRRNLWIPRAHPKWYTYVNPVYRALELRPVPCEALQVLFECTDDQTFCDPDDGSSLLHYAVKHSTVDVVQILVENGTELNVRWKHCANILEYAEYCYLNCRSSDNGLTYTQIIKYLQKLPQFADQQNTKE